jgi:argininosuccinate lyase
LQSLPLAYNRDLQEDKEPLFDALDTCMLSLSALTGLMSTIEFVDEAMTAGADSPANAATDIAEHLVRLGTPFREAHAIVGSVVRQSVERGVPLEELVSNHPSLGPDFLVFLEPGSGVRRRTSPGGAGPEPVAHQLELARERIERQQTWLAPAR